jgi:hypothetical protein
MSSRGLAQIRMEYVEECKDLVMREVMVIVMREIMVMVITILVMMRTWMMVHLSVCQCLHFLGGDCVNWPEDVGYDQHMHDPPAMGQDSDSGALWKSQPGGGAYYHAAADNKLPSLHLQVLKNVGFHRSEDHHVIPLDPNAIVNHFDTPRKYK